MHSQVCGGKVPFDQAQGGVANGHGIGRGNTLDSRRNVRCFPQGQLFVPPAAAHLAHDHWPRMDANAHRQPHPFVLLQPGIQCAHGLQDAQCRTHGALRIVFVRLRKAKVDQHAIAEILGDIAIKALDNASTGLLVCPDDLPQVFRVELAGEPGGIRQVTEHHRELAPFGVGSMGCGWGRCDWRWLVCWQW